MARIKPLAQSKTIRLRGITLGKAPKRRGNEIDLFDIATTVDAGREMQADPDFGQDGKVVVQILRGTTRDIVASQSAADPL
jgi:hypothetical protein